MTAVNLCDLCLYVLCVANCFALTLCNAASEVESKIGLCVLPRDNDCSACTNGHAKRATVKYCGNNAGKCVPCEDLRTLCLKRCHENAGPSHRLRKRRQVCSVVDKAVSKGPPNVTITSGLHGTKVVDQDLNIDCEVRTNPTAKVSWLFDGKPLSESLNEKRYTLRNCNKTLHIDTVELRDAGDYTCVGVNEFGNNTARSIISVRTASKDVPEILLFDMEKKHAYAGGTVKLVCEALATLGYISFEISGQTVYEDKQRLFYRHMSGASDYVKTALEINNVSTWDAGNYSCVAFDYYGKHTKKYFHLTVVPCPKGHFCPLGENEKYLCPPGTYNNGTNNVTYECTQCPYNPVNVSTKFPSGLTSITDCPQDKKNLHIVSFHIADGVNAYVGGTFKLICTALTETGSILFGKSGKIMETGGRVFYEELSTSSPQSDAYLKTACLEIRNVSASDSGNYSCTASASGPKHVRKYLRIAIVPCPKGHYCPLGENEKYLCPPGTYNNGTNNVTYECTRCPYNPVNVSTKFPSGLTSVTDCPQESSGSSSSMINPSGGNNMIWYISVPAGVLALVAVLMVSLRCFLVRRRLSSSERTNCLHIDVMRPGREINGGRAGNESGANLEAKYDVFICYSSKDTKFVQELIEELERRQFKCCVDFRDFVAGAPIVENITDAIYSSKKTLAVLSPDFVESKWCRHEIQQALARISAHLVVPLLLKQCDIPQLLLDRTYLDWESSVVKPHFWNTLDFALRA